MQHLTRRHFAKLALVGTFTGVLRPAFANDDPLAGIKSFFKGGIVGKGQYVSTVDSKPPRGMTMTMTGIEDGDMFRLRQDVVFSDGARDSNIWTFKQVAGSNYIGERTKVDGKVPVGIEGANKIRLEYIAPVPTDDGKWMTVRFTDRLVKVSERRVDVNTNVSYFGITVGHGELTFVR